MSFQGKKVLVVDDNADARDLLEDFLTPTGCQVVHASDGQKALEAIDASGAFDLVITDEVMPKLSGSQLFASIRQAKLETPVVIITGLKAHEIEPDRSLIPPPIVIEKPLKLKALLSQIEAIFSGVDAS